MEKESKLFDKRFVHFMWDDELKGKQCFVADNIGVLKACVESCESRSGRVVESDDNGYPFLYDDADECCGSMYQFAYYDPNYEAKWAYYKEGKKVQCKSLGEWVDCDTYPLWEDACQYRIKPESLGYARVETKGSDCDKQEGYTLAVSKCHWEDYIDHALPKENILDKPDCPCEEGIDSKACAGCEHSEDGKRKYKPYVTVDEFIQDFQERFPTAFPRPAFSMPLVWVRGRENGVIYLIDAFGKDHVRLDSIRPVRNFCQLFEYYAYLDGSPCGMEVNE